MPRPSLAAPPNHLQDVNDSNYRKWIDQFYNRVGENQFSLKGIPVANLPPANQNGDLGTNSFTSLIFVPDATGGAALAFSNGTDWISTITGVAV